MDFTFMTILDVIISFVALLFSLFLCISNKGNRTGNILLALFLVTSALDSSAGFVSHYIYPSAPGWAMMISLMLFFKYPLMFLYMCSVVFDNFRLQWKHLWHAWGFILCFLMFLPRYFLVDFDSKMQLLDLIEGESSLEIKITYLILHIQLSIYTVMTFVLLHRYKKILLENYSNDRMFHYKWLFQFVIILTVVTVIATFKNLFYFLHIEAAHQYALTASNIIFLGFICWIVIRALQNPEIFQGIDANLAPIDLENDKKTISKENEDVPNQEAIDAEIERLKAHMIEKMPFLNPSLTLKDLAKSLNVPSRDLSVLINHHLGQHFFDFINSFRINRAKEILADPDKKDLTVLEILYDVGFNSKSSFNTAFKKQTRQTPTEFRKASQNQ